MKNRLRTRQSLLGIALLTAFLLYSCGNHPAESNATEPKAEALIPPEAQKLGVQPQDKTTCPSNAPVKGKATRKAGEVYHLPTASNYAKVKPNICFADQATAEKAGFHPPKKKDNAT